MVSIKYVPAEIQVEAPNPPNRKSFFEIHFWLLVLHQTLEAKGFFQSHPWLRIQDIWNNRLGYQYDQRQVSAREK